MSDRGRVDATVPVAVSKAYRKRPVVIEALQWTGDNQQAIHDFTGGACHFDGDSRTGWDLVIHTLEGHGRATVRDFVIRGVQGEFYACKPEIFEATHEPVLTTVPAPQATPRKEDSDG